VGAARFLRALRLVVDPTTVTGIVNTGDDTVLHGLSISPDIDTITYTLAGAIDPERGWGLVDETWVAMGALARYAAVRPDGSTAAPTWFNLGDRDLATHFYRTARLAEGATLTEVTAEIAAAWSHAACVRALLRRKASQAARGMMGRSPGTMPRASVVTKSPR
jgi:LPPG:FO 2-phospho-L-lactate transferase